MWNRPRSSVLLVTLCCAACASLEQQQWYQTTREVTATTFDKVSGATSKAASRMQDYLSRKDVLQKFYDAGEHSEEAVLSVLHNAGVGKAKATTPKSAQANNAAKSKPSNGEASPKTPNKNSSSNASNKFPASYAGGYRWPLDAGIVSSEFGARWGKMHKGLDIAADVGEPVYAAAAGEVIYSGDGMRGYGNAIIVRHDDRVTSLYAHNSALKVKVGQKVSQGELIALLGSTGHSTGPHVHFEVRSGDGPMNPRTLLPKSMNAAVLPEDLQLDRNQLFAEVLPLSTGLLQL